MVDLAAEFVERLRRVLGRPQRPIPLHEPTLGEAEKSALAQCIDSGWVSSAGPWNERFEGMLKQFTGAREAVAVVNGTAALQLALRVAGVRAGDEVLLSPISFVATANAIAYLGAIPHFVDAEAQSLAVNPATLEAHLAACAEQHPEGLIHRATGRRIAALVVVHVFGHAADLPRLANLAARYALPLVEDAAEALGTRHGTRAAGCWSRWGTLSFNGNKIITTGGGGAVLTDDGATAAQLRHLATTAKAPHPWRYDHDQLGYNFRLPNLNAAMGCAQMERLPELLRRKRALAEAYATAFADSDRIRFVPEPPGTTSNYWLSTVRLIDNGDSSALDALLVAAHAAGFLCRPAWTPLSSLPMYASDPRSALPTANELARTILNLPSSAHLVP
jgi:perosamine synthetase